jgi:hypothetical protein
VAKELETRILAKEKPYPAELRRQLWPLCCGASILSGFKDVAKVKDEDELADNIKAAIDDYLPDLQVYAGETMMPQLTFLTLNSGQMESPKIMKAVEKAGFVKFAEAKPRGAPQGFFVRDMSGTFKAA